jgi:hypothetical protein
MTMSKIIGWIVRWIKSLWSDVTAGPALRERLALATEQVSTLKAELAKLKEEHGKIIADFREQQDKMSAYATRDEFITDLGILFKPSELKELRAVPYCPKCFMPMSAIGSYNVRFCCSEHEIYSTFKRDELQRVVAELSAKHFPD